MLLVTTPLPAATILQVTGTLLVTVIPLTVATLKVVVMLLAPAKWLPPALLLVATILLASA